MKFRTEINIAPFDFKIEHKSKVITLGSCFADNIAEKLIYYKFDVLQNPFGVLYNPVSIANALQIVFNKKIFVKEDLIFHQGEYHSFFHHSDFSHHDAETSLELINMSSAKTRRFAKNANLAILTFGTAFVYEHKESGTIVSNCHKIPQKEFNRFRLSLDETVKEITRAVKYLKLLNENVRVMFTVSPIRHWKDGAEENQRSKATLLLAVDKILRECNGVYYFPSYELMMDDLRDYRFYENDLLHPNSTAIEYIWEKFSASLFDEETRSLNRLIEKIIKAQHHKPRNPHSEQHKIFLKNLRNEIEKLETGFPELRGKFDNLSAGN